MTINDLANQFSLEDKEIFYEIMGQLYEDFNKEIDMELKKKIQKLLSNDDYLDVILDNKLDSNIYHLIYWYIEDINRINYADRYIEENCKYINSFYEVLLGGQIIYYSDLILGVANNILNLLKEV